MTFSVHCELLGNTPQHKTPDIRNEMMRDRLRKKLKKRRAEKEQLNQGKKGTGRVRDGYGYKYGSVYGYK